MVYGIVQLNFSDWNSVKFWFIRELGWHQDQTMGERENQNFQTPSVQILSQLFDELI